jgi:MSHA biogenesis protein MshL
LPLALSTIRETDTIVHARNGQVVVLGGLTQNQEDESIAKLPYFGNVPFLGSLMRNTAQASRRSEFVVLLRPVIIRQHTWQNALHHTSQKYQHLNRGFHMGDRPDLFGTRGERKIPYHHYYEPDLHKHHAQTAGRDKFGKSIPAHSGHRYS